LTTILECSGLIASAVRIVEIPHPDDVESEKAEAYLAAVSLFLSPGHLFTQSFSIILKGPNMDIQLLRSLSKINIGNIELHYSFPSYFLYRALDEIPSLANGGGLSLPPASCYPLDCTHPDKTAVLGAEAQTLTLEQIRKDEEPSLSEKRRIGSLAVDVAALASIIPLCGHFNWDGLEKLNLSWHWWQSCQDAVRVNTFRDMMEIFLGTVGRNVKELKLRVYSSYDLHYGELEKERMIGMWAHSLVFHISLMEFDQSFSLNQVSSPPSNLLVDSSSATKLCTIPTSSESLRQEHGSFPSCSSVPLDFSKTLPSL
jgi:hypothetical protein